MYALSQDGFAAHAAGDTQGYSRGMATPPPPAEPFAPLDLTDARCNYSPAGLAFGDETAIHAGYREWRRLIQVG